MTHDDLAVLDATAQAELVRTGAASARELVEAAIARIEALNPELNAVIAVDYEQALQTAAIRPADDAPFGGVPFLLKDIGANQAGLPYWAGNRALKEAGNTSANDTVLGSRFRSAGLITVGKTNLPELGSCPTTQPLSCGPTANPWDPTRSPAGSSGGSAAAVASGMVPMAHANDGGGSTRLPAAWCGLVGLKTTRGRVANPDSISRLVSELVVSRTVRDTARLLDAVEGATPADLYHTPRPEHPYARAMDADPGPLRIALLTDGGTVSVDGECVAGVELAARALEAMGHSVELVSSEVLLGPASAVNGRLWMAGIARRVDQIGEVLGRPLRQDEVEPYNWAASERGRTMTAVDWLAAEEAQQLWSRSVVEWAAGWDLLLTPTAGCPPLTTAELEPPANEAWRIGRTYGRIGVFTLPFNVTGQPAISLPLHETPAGLPVGVQLVGGMNREDLLLQVAAQLEQALPWADRRPVVFSGSSS